MRVIHIDTNKHTKGSLMICLQSDRSNVIMYNYLLIYGLIWPHSNVHNRETILNVMWNIIIRLILFINLVIILYNIMKHHYELGVHISWKNFFRWNLDIINICQIVILSSSLSAIDRKLNSASSSVEIECYTSMLKYSILYLIVSVVPIIFNAYRTILSRDLAFSEVTHFHIFILSELLMAGYLSIQLLFVLVDIKIKMMVVLKDVEIIHNIYSSSDGIVQEAQYRAKLHLNDVISIAMAVMLEMAMMVVIYMYDYYDIAAVGDEHLVLYCIKELIFIVVITIALVLIC